MLRVGAALELFQAAALFHDDVMDDSDTRRGFPAAHRAFAGLHAQHGLTGDPERFGMSAAILLGDLTLIASEQEFAGALARSRCSGPSARARSSTSCAPRSPSGQYLDVLAQALPWGDDPAADEARAREVIRAKAARYSVEHPIVARRRARRRRRERARGVPHARSAARRGVPAPRRPARACSATRGPPASPRVTTCARASGPCSPRARWPGPAPVATTRPSTLLRTRLGDRALTEADVTVLADGIKATGAPDDIEQLIDDLAGPRSRSSTRAPGPSRPGASWWAWRMRRSTDAPERARRAGGNRSDRGRGPPSDLGLAAGPQRVDRCPGQGVVRR